MPRTVKQNKHLQPGQPQRPTNLSVRAAAAWDKLAGELADSGIVLTPGHRTTLSMAATLAADIEDAWDRVNLDGAYIVTKAGLVAHPASKRLDALRRDYIKVLSMLGLRTATAGPKDDAPTLEEELED